MTDWFRRFATRTSSLVGTPWAFFGALVFIIGWAAAGPFFGWSEGHSLFVNTCTTVITFLMLFLVQYTQNRDAKAIHTKLDALLKAAPYAPDAIAHIEEANDAELERLRTEHT